MVELKDVSVTYSSGVDALHNVNLKINDGDFAFVVGASGAGKSTMIKLILKEINPTSGSIYVNGYNLNKLRRRRIPALRRTIGFVFQDFRLIPSMTVYENVAFVLRVIDAPTKYIRKRVPYVIGLVGLQDKTNAYPDELSGGEKQRVAIARALVNDPQLIIADEPTPGLDLEMALETLKIFRELADEGKAIVLITHDIDLAFHIADRVAVFYAGTTLEIADANDFLEGPEALRHPYSKALWKALPQNGFEPVPGFQPYAKYLPGGCLYFPRCPHRSDECEKKIPMKNVRGGRVRCIYAD